ncbi:hypothetical protein R0J90_08810 [Micrococcus sp. SIMBA_144]
MPASAGRSHGPSRRRRVISGTSTTPVPGSARRPAGGAAASGP